MPTKPFTIKIPQTELDDLQRRLDNTRWPERETVDDYSQGAPLERVQALVEHWRTRYDWRKCEARLNALPQFTTELEGLDIHFLHVRSPHANALPLLLTHGWPGSVVEFLDVIDPLTNPTAHGGSAEDAFHLVIPSLPGYGFSGKPARKGWGAGRIAKTWAKLMAELGYERYVAQGGDWGAAVTTALALHKAPGLAGIHLNLLFVAPRERPAAPDPDEQRAFAALDRYFDDGFGYAKLQSTRPQTLGYSLVDSPVGLAAYIYEKFSFWTDRKNLASPIGLDALLDNIMLYWLPGTGASASRLYWENPPMGFHPMGTIDLPVGCSIFPEELYPAPRKWADQCYDNIIHWNELDRGGHFAAFEQPAIFVDEVRACFRKLRLRNTR